MKKILIAAVSAILLIAVLVVANGCGAGQSSGETSGKTKPDSTELTAEKYDQLTEGLSIEQIKAIAGEPAKKETRRAGEGHSMGNMSGSTMKMEYWYFQGPKGWIRIEIGDDRLTSKSGF